MAQEIHFKTKLVSLTALYRCAGSELANQKLAGHLSLKTTMKFYVIVMASELDGARDVSNELLTSIEIGKQPSDLKSNPTDPLLTHFGQNGPKSSNPDGLPKSQGLENK